MEDFSEFLKICNLQNENLTSQIIEKSLSIDEFYEKRKYWLNLFKMNEQEFIKCIKLISFYKQALNECAEFDMEDIVSSENYESFLEYAEKYSTFLQENSSDSDIIQVKNEMLKLTYKIYLKSSKKNKSNNVEHLISPKVT